MKKILLILIFALIVLGGCEKSPSEIIEESSSSESSVSEESKQEETVEPEEDFEHNPVSKTVGIEDAALQDAKGGGAKIDFGNDKIVEIPIYSESPGIGSSWWYLSKEISAIIHLEDVNSSWIDILTTDNQGELWHEYMYGIEPGEIAQIKVHFYDAKNGYFSVNYADGTGILYRVKNRGSLIEKVGEVGNVYNMVFVDENHGFLVVSEDWVGIRKTSDGGKTWTDFEFAPPEFEYKQMRCYDRPVFTGDYGEVNVTFYLEGDTPWVKHKYITNNFGLTWEMK